jgi:hypothetical protein
VLRGNIGCIETQRALGPATDQVFRMEHANAVPSRLTKLCHALAAFPDVIRLPQGGVDSECVMPAGRKRLQWTPSFDSFIEKGGVGVERSGHEPRLPTGTHRNHA